MNIDVRVVDVSEQLPVPSGQVPYAMLKREIAHGHFSSHVLVPAGKGPYRILQAPIDQQHRWSVDKGGAHVAIPLYPYLLGAEPSLLPKFGAQIGALAMAAGLAESRPAGLVVALSAVFSRPDNQPGYCVYAGVAIREEG